MSPNKELNLFKDLITALKGKLRPNSVVNIKVALNQDLTLTDVWVVTPGNEERVFKRVKSIDKIME